MNEPSNDSRPDHSPPSPVSPTRPPSLGRVIPSGELFGSDNEVLIDHAGSLYRLRLTRSGKLILHK